MSCKTSESCVRYASTQLPVRLLKSPHNMWMLFLTIQTYYVEQVSRKNCSVLMNHLLAWSRVRGAVTIISRPPWYEFFPPKSRVDVRVQHVARWEVFTIFFDETVYLSFLTTVTRATPPIYDLPRGVFFYLPSVVYISYPASSTHVGVSV